MFIDIEKQKELRSKIENGMNLTPKEYDSYVISKGRKEFANKLLNLLKEKLDSTKKYTTLEVGAGTGIITEKLNIIENLNIITLEKLENFLSYAILQKRIKKEQAIIGDFHKLPFKDNSFDLYTGVAILNQRNNIDLFYQEIIRVLKKDGLLFIPWVKPKLQEKSFEREISYFKKYSINVIEKGDWYLIGKK